MLSKKILQIIAILCLATTAVAGEYVDILNNSNSPPGSITQCVVGSSGIEPNQCVSIPTPNSNLQGIAFNGNYAYITSFYMSPTTYTISAGYTQCFADSYGIESSTCTGVGIPNTSNYASQAIAFNGDYAYVLSINPGDSNDYAYYTKCPVEATGLDTSQCNTSFIQFNNYPSYGFQAQPEAIAFIGNYAYITDSIYNYLIQCNVDNSGNLVNCSNLNLNPNNPNPLSSPTGIAFNNGYAYILNSITSSYIICSADTSGINVSSCSQPYTTAPHLFAPFGIAFNNGFAYITQSDYPMGNSYLQCSVGSNGILINCVENQTSPAVLSIPKGIAFN